MSAQWRLFLLALRYFTRIPVPAWVLVGDSGADSAARFLPLVGAVVGCVGGLVYWLAAVVWPTSVAVALSMFATLWVTGGIHELGLADLCRSLEPERQRPTGFAGFGMLVVILLLFARYSGLMALSGASLPFPVPSNVGLGLFMIAGHAASRALVVSVIATREPMVVSGRNAVHVTAMDLVVALLTGFLPATVLGLPGLIGLATAIVTRLLLLGLLRGRKDAPHGDYLGATQQLTELSFYLGTLGAWTYI
jgi:adenosylcobinamide-GDP ribazoletransferase